VTIADERYGAQLRHDLQVVLTALWHEIDHNGGLVAASFFTPDALLRFGDASFRGTEAIAAVYTARAARGSRVSRHLVTNLHLLEVSEYQVSTVSALLLFAEDGVPPRQRTAPTLMADVWDEFAFVEGRWLISSRWIQNLFLESSEDLAVPVQ
jgi:hypothetical protein